MNSPSPHSLRCSLGDALNGRATEPIICFADEAERDGERRGELGGLASCILIQYPLPTFTEFPLAGP